MTTPRIEELVEEFLRKAKDDESRDFTQGCWECGKEIYPEGIADWLRQALTQAHQAGRDEAVEIINGIEDGFYGKPCCYGHYCCNETGYKQALDDTIKALQDNK